MKVRNYAESYRLRRGSYLRCLESADVKTMVENSYFWAIGYA
jgi:hypothetical protein